MVHIVPFIYYLLCDNFHELHKHISVFGSKNLKTKNDAWHSEDVLYSCTIYKNQYTTVFLKMQKSSTRNYS